MTTIDELIKEFCPDGVEYKLLGGECKVLRGMRLTKELLSGGNCFPVFHGGIVPIGYYDKANRDANTVMVINVGASAGTIGFSNVPFWSSDGCFCLSHGDNLDSKYLYYALKKTEHKIRAKMRVAGIPTLDAATVNKLYIPIPRIEVQKEIVRILDSFTELISELEAELAARRKQYEQYRDKLLTFGDDVERRPLEKVGISFVRGCGIKRDEVTAGGVPCVRYGEIYTTYNIGFDSCVSHTNMEIAKRAKWFEYGDILFAITGEKIEDIAKCCAYLGHEKCCAGGDIVVMKHNQNPKYLAYALSTVDAQKQKSKGKTKSKVVHSSIPALKTIMIPVPSLPEQERIVAILDKFDALCNDETAGLVAEIAARKKQYEYYRDRLLNFKRKGDGGSVESAQSGKRNSPRKGGGYYTEDGMERLKRSGMKGHEAAERLITEQIGERHRLLRPLTREAARILKSVKGMIPRALFLSNAIVREAERRVKEEKT